MAVSLPNSLGDFPVGLPSDYFRRTMDLLSRIQQAEDFNKDSRGAKAARLISPIVDKPEVIRSQSNGFAPIFPVATLADFHEFCWFYDHSK